MESIEFLSDMRGMMLRRRLVPGADCMQADPLSPGGRARAAHGPRYPALALQAYRRAPDAVPMTIANA